MTLTLVNYDEVKAGLKAMLDEHYERISFAIRYGSLPDMITVGQTAKLIGLSPRTVRKMVAENNLRSTRHGKTILVLKEDVIRHLQLALKQGK